jgi:polyhydroxybutyrate depolymerase
MGRKLTLTQEYIRDFAILVLIALGIFLFIKIKAWTAETTTMKLTSSGEERSYQLYVPKSYDSRSSAPLVISLHGYNSKPSDIIFSSRWNDLADEEGVIMAYPLGISSPTYWHTSGTAYYDRSAETDIQFISDLIDQIEGKYNIDPSRIYVNGISMGGGMSHVLACGLADRIAAIGSVSGAYNFPPDQCDPSRPVPFIAFHGTEDPTIPYNGGVLQPYNINYPSIPSFIKAWAEKNQCTDKFDVPQDGEISIMKYTHCALDADVELYTIYGGGHTWPGDQPSPTESIWGYTTRQIDATQLMWQFFEQHPLPEND